MPESSCPESPQSAATMTLKQQRPEIESQLMTLCRQGYALHDKGDFKNALRKFYSAWALLPKPQSQWVEATWVLTALGDAYYSKGDYENSQRALNSALYCPEGMGNPVIHIRLGQCLSELGDNDAARAEFVKACEHGGETLVLAQEERYLALL
jgi:tetratricopeptide (TPR) repeat protein